MEPDATRGRPLLPIEEPFRILVEQVADYAIFMLDREGRVATWNAGAQRIKGYAADEIIGQPYARFFPPESAGEAERMLSRARAEGRAESEGWRLRKDGSRFWASAVLTALRDPKTQEIVGFAKVTRDLTERREAEVARMKLAEETTRRASATRVVELLTRLHALAAAMGAARSPGELATVLVREGAAALGATSAAFFRPSGDALALIATAGAPAESIGMAQPQPFDAGGAVPAAYRTRSPIWIDTAARYRELFPDAPVAPPDGSLMVLPLVLGERVLAVLALYFASFQALSPEQRAVMRSWADQAAQAVDRVDSLSREHAVEDRARALQASLSTTLFSIGDAVIATDARGAVTFMNPVAEALTGWRDHEARGLPLSSVFRIINEHSRAPVVSPVDKVLESGAIVGLANHTLLIARDGREIPIDDSGAPIRREGSTKIEGVVLVFRDVTATKREERRDAFLSAATAALSESLDYDATLAKVAKLAVPQLADWCAVYLVDSADARPRRLAVAHTDPTKVSMALESEATPLRRDAAIGVANVLRTGKAELYARIPDELLATGAAEEEQLRIGRELGVRSAMVAPLRGSTGTLGAITFAIAESQRVYDEHDLRLAQELARRCAIAIENARLYEAERRARRSADIASRSKDEFLAMVSHELRTPLNAIVGWSQLLRSASIPPEKQGQAIATIERNAAAMARLIEDMLDMSRVVSGKMRLEVQPMDLASTVELAARSIRPAADAKQIDLVRDIERMSAPFMGDASRIQQIVWNLVSNAVKFTPHGGRVEVGLRKAESAVELWVRDTGQGITPAFLPFVFEPFRQQDSGFARGRGGLGLGLAITRQLVELHGGHIHAHSEGEGRGTTFTVSLPHRVARRPERRDTPMHAIPVLERPAHVRGARVLVVDDEPDARTLVRTVLESAGCVVTEASSVNEAIELFEREVPDLLLSDVGMPERTGFDLIRHVRSVPPERGGDVPAAALTAFARPEDRRRLLNAGFSIHVPKPIEPPELIAVVASLTRFRRSPSA